MINQECKTLMGGCQRTMPFKNLIPSTSQKPRPCSPTTALGPTPNLLSLMLESCNTSGVLTPFIDTRNFNFFGLLLPPLCSRATIPYLIDNTKWNNLKKKFSFGSFNAKSTIKKHSKLVEQWEASSAFPWNVHRRNLGLEYDNLIINTNFNFIGI